ncbi:MAG: TonB-dependent receptor [Sulfuritalea sp.]|nr:TonB-dependent receptor [Sulfuritalea sp.]MDP1982591.1 TonB-dependent receptor [Sulfuritalea sp.]
MPTVLLAEDVSGMNLEDLLRVEVQGASRYAQPLAEAPSSATVIPAADIRRFGFRDIGEALQSARGVYTSNDRVYSYLGVRGFSRPGDYNSRILLLVDGARSNDPIYDQAMVGNDAPVDIDWIKRLEFVPGPSSASYGGNALFGIVNAVLLWTGADLNGSRVSFDVGDGRGGRASVLSGGRTAGGFDWVAGLSAYGRRGDDLYFAEYDAPGVGDGVAHRRDGERYLKAMFKGSWENWRGSATFSQRRKNVPTAYFSTDFDAPGNFVRDTGFHLDIARTSTLAEFLDQQLRVHLGRYAYDGDYPIAGVINRDETRADWWSAEWQLTWTGWRDHRLLGGIEARNYERLEQRNFDVSPRLVNLDDRHRGRTAGLFVQDEWRFASSWLANVGLRLDSQTNAPTLVSPRAALIWHPRDELTLKLMSGSAFRAPNDYERLYGDNGTSQKGNPDLRPERIRSREAALEYTPTPTLRLGLGHYQYTLRDLIDQETDPADGLLVFRNRDSLSARGWETDVEKTFGSGWRIRGSLAWQSIDQPGGEAVNSPRRLGKLLVDGPITALGATLGINLQAVGPRRSVLGGVAGYVTGNAVLRQVQQRGHGLWSLGIYNLADKRYRDPLGSEVAPIDSLERDGRQWRLRWELDI